MRQCYSYTVNERLSKTDGLRLALSHAAKEPVLTASRRVLASVRALLPMLAK